MPFVEALNTATGLHYRVETRQVLDCTGSLLQLFYLLLFFPTLLLLVIIIIIFYWFCSVLCCLIPSCLLFFSLCVPSPSLSPLFPFQVLVVDAAFLPHGTLWSFIDDRRPEEDLPSCCCLAPQAGHTHTHNDTLTVSGQPTRTKGSSTGSSWGVDLACVSHTRCWPRRCLDFIHMTSTSTINNRLTICHAYTTHTQTKCLPLSFCVVTHRRVALSAVRQDSVGRFCTPLPACAILYLPPAPRLSPPTVMLLTLSHRNQQTARQRVGVGGNMNAWEECANAQTKKNKKICLHPFSLSKSSYYTTSGISA